MTIRTAVIVFAVAEAIAFVVFGAAAFFNRS